MVGWGMGCVTASARGVFGCRLGRDREAALVVAAVGTDVVRQLHLVAVRALFERRDADREVRTALALTGMRDASLGYTHGVRGLLRVIAITRCGGWLRGAGTSGGDHRTDGGV